MLLNNLLPFINQRAASFVKELLLDYNGQITVSKPRKTKLGDFKVKNGSFYISINSNLSADQFLITLIHELAHFFCFKKYGSKVQAHGPEWKSIYKDLLLKACQYGAFENQLMPKIKQHALSPRSSSTLDTDLYLELNPIKEKGLLYINTLCTGDLFAYQNKGTFKVSKFLTKRVKCMSLNNGRSYLFQPTARVTRIT